MQDLQLKKQKGRARNGPTYIDFYFFDVFKDPKVKLPTMFFRNPIAPQFLGNLNEGMIYGSG